MKILIVNAFVEPVAKLVPGPNILWNLLDRDLGAFELLVYIVDHGQTGFTLKEVLAAFSLTKDTFYSLLIEIKNLLGLDQLLIEDGNQIHLLDMKVSYDAGRFEKAARTALEDGGTTKLDEAITMFLEPFMPGYEHQWTIEKGRILSNLYVDLLFACAKSYNNKDLILAAHARIDTALDYVEGNGYYLHGELLAFKNSLPDPRRKYQKFQ